MLIAWRGPAGIVDALALDGNPPVFYFLLWAWMWVFGSSEVAVRALPALFGVISVVAVYAAAREFFPSRRFVALAAGVATMVGPLHLYYSQECRMYSLTPLIGVLALVALHRALDGGKLRCWIAHAALLAAGLYSHNYFLFVLPVGAAAALLAPGHALGRRKALTAALVTAGAAVLVWSPWIPILVQQSRSGVSAWIPRFWESTPPSLALFRSFEVMGVGGEFPGYLLELGRLRTVLPAPQVWSSLRVAGTLLGAGLVLAGLVAAIRRDDERRTGVRVLLFLVLPLALPWAASYVITPIYLVGRYEMVVFTAYAILVARGFAALALPGAAERARLAVAAVVALVWLAGAGLCLVAYFRSSSHPDLLDDKLVADWLLDQADPKDAVILPGYARAVPEYYLARCGSPIDRISFPAEVGLHYGWFDFNKALTEPAFTRAEAAWLADDLRRVVDGGGRVFLVVSGVTPPQIINWIADEMTRRYGMAKLAHQWRRDFYVASFGR